MRVLRVVVLLLMLVGLAFAGLVGIAAETAEFQSPNFEMSAAVDVVACPDCSIEQATAECDARGAHQVNSSFEIMNRPAQEDDASVDYVLIYPDTGVNHRDLTAEATFRSGRFSGDRA